MPNQKRVYQLVCVTQIHEGEESEFTLGIYSSQLEANKQKELSQKEADEARQDLEYRIIEHILL